MTLANTFASFQFNNFLVTTRLVAGSFPNVDSVLNPKTDFSITIELNAFKAAIERVSLFSKDTEFNTVELEFSPSELRIFANANGNEAEEFIEIKGGADLRIGFNYRYLTDWLNSIDAQFINIAFGDQYSPSVWKIAGDDDFIGIITPVRLR